MSVSRWRSRWWLWAIPLVLVVLNGAVLSSYRLIYAGRVALLRSQIGGEAQNLRTVERQREQLSQLVERASLSRDGIEQLYGEAFSTESRRLTSLIREVKDLATRSGLIPALISYPDEELEDHGLLRRSMVFSVEGSYADLRKFINLLELSDSFVSLASVRLSGAAPSLRISMELTTFFSGRDGRIRTDGNRVTPAEAEVGT